MKFSLEIKCSLILLGVLFIFSNINAQIITTSSSGNNIDYNLDNFPPLIEGVGFHAPPDTFPFYKLFWIYGDGNYEYGGNMYPGFTYDHSHTYLPPNGMVPAPYETEALVKERKTDNVPPKRLFTLPPINLLNSVTPDDYINNRDTIIEDDPDLCKRVGIINSHLFKSPLKNQTCYYMEDSIETAFALAFKPKTTGKLFFLYPDVSSDPLMDAFMDTEFQGLPHKTPIVRYGDFIIGDGSNVNRRLISNNSSDPYHKVISYDISELDTEIDNLNNDDGEEELRLFHILRSNNVIEGTRYPFMVLLASDSLSDWNNCGSTNYTADGSFVSKYMKNSTTGELYPNLVLSPAAAAPLYFVDADTISLKGGEPKDPNSLRVTDICCCDPTSCNDYWVSFELQFFNEEEMPTYSSSIIIKDLSGQFECIKPQKPFAVFSKELGNLDQRAVLNWNDVACKKGDPNLYSYPFNQNAEYFCVDYSPLEKYEVATFKFTARTNQSGLNALLDNNALKACVIFHETGDTVCTTNIPLDTTACIPSITTSTVPISVKDDKTTTTTRLDSCAYHQPGYRVWKERNEPCESNCKSCCQTYWCYICEYVSGHIWVVISGVLILFAFFFYRRKKRKEQLMQ